MNMKRCSKQVPLSRASGRSKTPPDTERKRWKTPQVARGRKSPRYLASRWQEPSRVVTAWALPHLLCGVGRLRNDDPDGLETETGIRASTGVPGHLQHGFWLDNHGAFPGGVSQAMTLSVT